MLLKIRDSIFIYIPFIVTREKAIELIIRELQLKNNSVLYDLGCGDGRILTRAIRNTPGARGIGMEKGIIPYLLACMRTRKLPIKIMYKDLFSTDLSGATHIYCYLHHTVMGKVEEKIIDECKKGTRIVVNDYPFTALIAQENIFTQEDGSPLSSKIYTYTL
jgi:16S rRNA A1518/A1519 N6-dimethyltransferase RsmA/KsgA/DIM1 with predicted DNA glycosylase/AP lyase activity